MKISNPLLDKNVINAFIDGAQKTLEILANTPINTGQPVVNQTGLKPDVTGLIGVVFGDVKGRIALNFPKQTIFNIMKQMLDEDHTEISADVVDAVGEMTNQIYGTAKTILNDSGYTFEMAIPTVIYGDFVMHQSGPAANILIPFTTETGDEFNIDMTIEKPGKG